MKQLSYFFFALIFLISPILHAQSPERSGNKDQEAHQSLVNSCTAQMMSYVATAYQSKGEYKVPVFNHAEDTEIVDSMQELVKIGKAISDEQAGGRPVESIQIDHLNSILEKTGKIFHRRASIELDLCIEYNESLLKGCVGSAAAQNDGPKKISGTKENEDESEKLEACAKSAEEKPEIRRKKDALLSVLKKRLLVSKLSL